MYITGIIQHVRNGNAKGATKGLRLTHKMLLTAYFVDSFETLKREASATTKPLSCENREWDIAIIAQS